jgi:nitrogen regulatory protein PII-like uncharacterized protein
MDEQKIIVYNGLCKHSKFNGLKTTKMIDTIEKLLQDYASYSFMEGTIDEDTMNHLVEDAQNYVAKLNKLNLLSLHDVSKTK